MNDELYTRVVKLVNPLPNATEAEIADMAGVFDPKAGDRPAFRFEIQWGGTGVDGAGTDYRQELFLNPGVSQENVSESAAKVILLQHGERGLVSVGAKDDERKKILEGLNRAREYYLDAGPRRILRYQQRHALTDEQMKLEKDNIKAYFLNAAKAELIEKAIKNFNIPKFTKE